MFKILMTHSVDLWYNGSMMINRVLRRAEMYRIRIDFGKVVKHSDMVFDTVEAAKEKAESLRKQNKRMKYKITTMTGEVVC